MRRGARLCLAVDLDLRIGNCILYCDSLRLLMRNRLYMLSRTQTRRHLLFVMLCHSVFSYASNFETLKLGHVRMYNSNEAGVGARGPFVIKSPKMI